MTALVKLPSALNSIVDRLGFTYFDLDEVGGFKTFGVDLTSWGLNLSDQTPCIWVESSHLHTLTAPQLVDSINDVMLQRSWQNETILVFVDGNVPVLRLQLPTAMPAYVVFDRTQQKSISESNSPTAASLDIILSQLSRSQLAPYETNRPVTGGRFYGRQAEINKVLQHPNRSCLFVGIRRVGKTSLLRELERRMNKLDPVGPGQKRRLHVNCTVISTELDFLRELTVHLAPSELKLLMGRASKSIRYQRVMFDRFADIQGGPITIFIDELDRLLARIGDEAELWDVLRDAASDGKARFIMAGFRQAMDASTNLRSPFFNMVDSIDLGEFKRSDVQSLVMQPMGRLRVSIHNPEGVVNRIVRETAALPNYVQYYCRILLEKLDEDKRDVITEDDLGLVYDNREFRNFVLDAFSRNTEPLEQALVYLMISHSRRPLGEASFSEEKINQMLEESGLPVNLYPLTQALRNLEVAGVLNRAGRNYELAEPLLQQMLRQTRDVGFLFRKTREEILAT